MTARERAEATFEMLWGYKPYAENKRDSRDVANIERAILSAQSDMQERCLTAAIAAPGLTRTDQERIEDAIRRLPPEDVKP